MDNRASLGAVQTEGMEMLRHIRSRRTLARVLLPLAGAFAALTPLTGNASVPTVQGGGYMVATVTWGTGTGPQLDSCSSPSGHITVDMVVGFTQNGLTYAGPITLDADLVAEPNGLCNNYLGSLYTFVNATMEGSNVAETISCDVAASQNKGIGYGFAIMIFGVTAPCTVNGMSAGIVSFNAAGIMGATGVDPTTLELSSAVATGAIFIAQQ